MLKKLLFVITMFLAFNASAQHVCGTHAPTQTEFQYILNTIATQPIPKNGGTTCIPIQAHVVRETNGTGGVSLQDIHEGVAYLNEYYKAANIEFYFCGTSPNYIDNSTYYDFQDSEENALAAAAGENNNAINMYFVDEINYTGGPSYTAGYAYTPANSVTSTRIVLRNDNVAEGGTIVHEMGHHYALLHTFETSQVFVPGTGLVGGPELVNGSNCTTAGDLLCDTPADPGYNGTNVFPPTCVYNDPSTTDANGAQYNPAIDNVMSYYPSQCQNPFVLTPDQIARIQQGLTTRQGHSAYDMSCAASNVTDPSGLTATIVGSTVVLNWTDNSTNEMGFFIERSTTSATGGFEAFGGWGVAANTTTFTDNVSIPTGTTYYYRVKASNDGCNDYSNVAPAGAPVCGVTAITEVSQTACDPNTNTYTETLSITYNNPPTTGSLDVNGQTFTITTSPQTVTLTGLTADGLAVDVIAFFTAETTCTFTANSVFTAPASCAVAPACSAGDVDPTLDGTTVDYCPGSILDLLTDGNENIPTGEDYLWVFQNATDTFFINTGGSYSGDLNAALVGGGGTAIPDGTYTVFALVTDSAGTVICDVTPGDFTVNVLPSTDPLCGCSAGDVDPSLINTSVDYCPGTTLDLLTDGTQVIPTGEDYIWVFQNATDTFFVTTGGSYSGDLNTAIVGGGGTPIPAGTYTVFALVTDSAGTVICDVTPGSYTVNVLTATDPICTGATCSISTITAGTTSACDVNTNTYTQELIITYSNAPSGTLNVNGQTFAVTTSPQTVTLTGLTANGNNVDATAFFTSDTSCTFTATNAFTAPASCATVACNISGLTFGATSACNPVNDTYTQEVTITYTNAPAGTIEVNGQVFAQTTSPQTVTLTGLVADGNSVNVTAVFTNDATCTFTENNAFTAPVSCSSTCIVGDVNPSLDGTTVDYCPGTTLDLLTDSTEVVPTGEDYYWVFLNATDTVFVNTGGSFSGDINALLVGSGGTAIPFGTYTVFAVLTENGGTAICGATPGDFTVNVLDANDPICSGAPTCSAGDVAPSLDGTTVNYCPGTNITVATDGTENILTGEAYLWVFMSATDTFFLDLGPSYTGDLNADLVTAGGTALPFGSYLVFGLTTDAGATAICDVTPGDFTINILDANDPLCTSPCSITAITSGTQTTCNPTNNTYTQEVTITYSNAPTGTINVNGQTFAVTTSPQTVTLTGLISDGLAVDVTAFFTNSATCTFTQTSAFTAPVACGTGPCSITGITAGAQSACNPVNNTYTQELTITYSNAPTGTININGQTFAVTSSPQTVTLSNLIANGNNVNIVAFFTNATACNFSALSVFAAPVACSTALPTDSLVVMMIPDGAGTLTVGTDVITATPFVGVYPINQLLDISVTTTGTNVFDFWRLNNQTLLDFSTSTNFLFINQDTLFAYFNGAVGVQDLNPNFSSFNVYPTVVDDYVTISFETLKATNLSVDLFAIDGKLINNLYNNDVDAHTLYQEKLNFEISSGLYFLRFTSEGNIFTTKIVKLN